MSVLKVEDVKCGCFYCDWCQHGYYSTSDDGLRATKVTYSDSVGDTKVTYICEDCYKKHGDAIIWALNIEFGFKFYA